MVHLPVLRKEVIEYLKVENNKNFVDGTAGEGGHTVLILEKSAPKGKVLAIERDPSLAEKCRLKTKEFQDRIIVAKGNYADIAKIVAENSFCPVNGVLLDLGLSSWHLESSKRGFSFLREEALDMRFDPESSLTASEIVNSWPEENIYRILKEYGEERFARKIAKRIVEERPIETTEDLNRVISKAVGRRERIHPSTRTFQALRIAVNRELENLEEALPEISKILEPEGRIVVLSFHSLEDRIVKNFFKNQKGLKIINKKPVTADSEEIKTNPRARSCKLRAAEKI